MKWLSLLIIAAVVGTNQVPTIQLKESIRVGGIEFTPISVEVRPIQLLRPSMPSDELFKSDTSFTVLTYRLTNVTGEQAISTGVLQGQMEDQFGNMHSLIMGYEICPFCIINEPIQARELLPGDSQRLVAVFQAPKIPKAELFTITVNFVKDNKNQRGEAVVMFKRSEMANQN